MADSQPQQFDQPEILATFARTNKQTRAPEALRILLSPFKGYLYTHFRLVYRGTRPTRQDDGWRWTPIHISLRECELDQAIAALEEVRRRVHSEGRSTTDERVASFERGQRKGFKPTLELSPSTSPNRPRALKPADDRDIAPWEGRP